MRFSVGVWMGREGGNEKWAARKLGIEVGVYFPTLNLRANLPGHRLKFFDKGGETFLRCGHGSGPPNECGDKALDVFNEALGHLGEIHELCEQFLRLADMAFGK